MNGIILVTGGCGYIGSHVVVQLIENGYEVILFDNLSNSSISVINKIEEITQKKPYFVKGDVRDAASLQHTFSQYPIDAVIHLAGLKAVGEAEKKPLEYYDNNVQGSMVLLKAMSQAGVYRLIFSSSATVYGNPGYFKYTEQTPMAPTNVYGRTKMMVEQILCDLKNAHAQWQIVSLRYFNPIGAHYSGLIGENPKGVPNNLMPYIAQVAVGRRDKLNVFGGDFPTSDGTGERDYIHVDDLASGHVKALSLLQDLPEIMVLNLGTGRTHSVLELLRTFEKVSGQKIPYQITERRTGDLPMSCADPKRAQQVLNWTPAYELERMCEDVWRWQTMNPEGYEK